MALACPKIRSCVIDEINLQLEIIWNKSIQLQSLSAAAPRLGQPWIIVPAEQQMERKPEGTDFQEFSSHPGTAFVERFF